MKRNASMQVYNVNVTTEFMFKREHCDPVTTKPLVLITGLIDENGNTVPPFFITCNVLVSMGATAIEALALWAEQGPETAGNA